MSTRYDVSDWIMGFSPYAKHFNVDGLAKGPLEAMSEVDLLLVDPEGERYLT